MATKALRWSLGLVLTLAGTLGAAGAEEEPYKPSPEERKLTEQARMWLADGKKIDAPFQDGLSLLHLAVKSGYQAAASFLIEKGANPNAKGPKDQAPLHVAAAKGDQGVAEVLLQYGAAHWPKDDDGNSPDDAAKEAKQDAMEKFLQERAPRVKIDLSSPEAALQTFARAAREADTNAFRRCVAVKAERGLRRLCNPEKANARDIDKLKAMFAKCRVIKTTKKSETEVRVHAMLARDDETFGVVKEWGEWRVASF